MGTFDGYNAINKGRKKHRNTSPKQPVGLQGLAEKGAETDDGNTGPEQNRVDFCVGINRQRPFHRISPLKKSEYLNFS
jgi:hypothetical protein